MKQTLSFLVFFVLLAGGASFGAVEAHPIGAVGVTGNKLTADGEPWVPRGVVVVGLLAAQPSPFPKYAAAAAHWGSAEVAAIKAYGADVVRFEVSQPGLDPHSPLYTPAYPSRISAAVHAVRSAGMAVILAMQWHWQTGMYGLSSMPDESTLRAWQALAPVFAGDPGVMYELFNEPLPPRGYRGRAEGWAMWTVEFQKLINRMRAITTDNVLIVDGIQRRISPAAADSLSDSAARLAFTVHPYPRDPQNDAAAWDRRFGNVALRHAVVLTEWNSTSRYACQPNTPELAQQFLFYIHERQIGILGFAFDFPGSLVKDFSFTPTNYLDFQCSRTGDNGAGELLHKYFQQSK